jgi:hypothetical protein
MTAAARPTNRLQTISDEDVRQMRADYDGGLTVDEVFFRARQRGTLVSRDYVRLIVNGKARKP